MNLARQMASDVTVNMRAKGFPISHVSYGPQRFADDARRMLQSDLSGLALIFGRDRDGGDRALDVRGSQRNARKLLTWRLGCELYVVARSPLDGARVEEHEEICEQCVAQLLVELDKWTTAARAGECVVSEARYLRAEELDGLECASGVIYRLRFSIDRGVTDTNFDGSALSVASFDVVARANIGGRISIDGVNYEDIPNADST